MSGLVEIKTRLVEQLREAYEGSDPTLQIEGRYLINPSPPTIDVYAGRTPSRDDETAGFDDLAGGYVLTVRARMLTADSDAGQEILDELMDDESEFSLQAAIEAADMGGHTTDIHVRSTSGLTVYPDLSGALKYLGFEFEVLLLAATS